MKPDWKDAPKWAKYLAQDKCGEWFWYQVKPIADSDFDSFRCTKGKVELADNECNETWKETLEPRP